MVPKIIQQFLWECLRGKLGLALGLSLLVAFGALQTLLLPGVVRAGETTRVSVASDGMQGNGLSLNPSISGDGRYVAFWSGANTLVPGDTNGNADIFVHDRQTGQTTRVSVASDGTQENGGSEELSISADGRSVAFDSGATNLVPGDTNSSADIFVHDREAILDCTGLILVDGEPLAGAPVKIRQADGTRQRTKTNEAGQCAFNNVSPGPFKVKISGTAPGSTVSGDIQVLGESLTGAPVKIAQSDGAIQRTKTGPAGEYAFENVPAGPFRATIKGDMP